MSTITVFTKLLSMSNLQLEIQTRYLLVIKNNDN